MDTVEAISLDNMCAAALIELGSWAQNGARAQTGTQYSVPGPGARMSYRRNYYATLGLVKRDPGR
jgi:hypothetical protein